jgi:hypothetical protein
MSVTDNPKEVNFPDQFAPEAVKKTDEYGLQYAKAMWASYQATNLNVFEQRKRDIINRKYAEGMESIQKYKDRLDLNGDTSFLNLDFSPTTRIAMIIDNMVGKLMDAEYDIQCTPVDPASRVEVDNERDEMYTNMFLAPYNDDIQKMTGIPLVAKSKKLPRSDEEAELFFQIDFKQAGAIAMEEALDVVFGNNNFEDTKRRVIKDLLVTKKAAVHKFYDENNNIRIDYVDPLDLIYPYSKYDDFRNVPYVGVVKNYTIQEIAQMTDKFTETELAEIAKSQAGKNNNPQWASTWTTSYEGYYASMFGVTGRPYNNFNIQVMEFYYLTTNKVKYMKKSTAKGGSYFEKKNDVYKVVGEVNGKELVERDIQFIYSGKLIIGLNKIFNYKMCNNIERDMKVLEDGNRMYSPKAVLPIMMIFPDIRDMQSKSLVERMIPHEDQINLIELKIQQLLIKMKPPGIAVDEAALAENVKGMGGEAMKPVDLIRMYEQTGSYVYSSVRSDGSAVNNKAVMELMGGVSQSVNSLIMLKMHEIDMINQIIGYNSSVDASTPDQKSLVGTQKMAYHATNNSLRPLNQCYIDLVERAARRLSLMIQDSIEYNEEGFKVAIGQQAVNTLKYGKKMAYNEYAISIDMLPDEEERAQIEQMIVADLTNQVIKSSDAIMVRQILKTNVKLAAQMLVLREKKNREDKMEESAQLQQQNTDTQTQSAQAAEQARAQAEQQIIQAKQALLQLEYQLKGQLSSQEASQAERLMILQNTGKVEVQEKANEGKIDASVVDHHAKLSHSAFESAVTPEPSVSK